MAERHGEHALTDVGDGATQIHEAAGLTFEEGDDQDGPLGGREGKCVLFRSIVPDSGVGCK